MNYQEHSVGLFHVDQPDSQPFYVAHFVNNRFANMVVGWLTRQMFHVDIKTEKRTEDWYVNSIYTDAPDNALKSLYKLLEDEIRRLHQLRQQTQE